VYMSPFRSSYFVVSIMGVLGFGGGLEIEGAFVYVLLLLEVALVSEYVCE
jgi:hypothetical protein